MGKVKEMPFEEKYAMVVDNMKFDETFILPFVQKHLGDEALAEFKKTCLEGTKQIPETASLEEKYEIAYSNWIWMAKTSYSFIRKKMGEEGLEKFKLAEVEALKRKNAGPALFLLSLVRLFSKGSAFAMISQKMVYQLQWISPSSVSELTRNRVVVEIPHCKILDFPETEDVCFIGCQSTYPKWVFEQFKAKMAFQLRIPLKSATLSG